MDRELASGVAIDAMRELIKIIESRREWLMDTGIAERDLSSSAHYLVALRYAIRHFEEDLRLNRKQREWVTSLEMTPWPGIFVRRGAVHVDERSLEPYKPHDVTYHDQEDRPAPIQIAQVFVDDSMEKLDDDKTRVVRFGYPDPVVVNNPQQIKPVDGLPVYIRAIPGKKQAPLFEIVGVYPDGVLDVLAKKGNEEDN